MLDCLKIAVFSVCVFLAAGPVYGASYAAAGLLAAAVGLMGVLEVAWPSETEG